MDELVIRNRGRRNRLLHKPIEEHSSCSGCAAIESEGVLVEVVVRMFAADGTLMSAK